MDATKVKHMLSEAQELRLKAEKRLIRARALEQEAKELCTHPATEEEEHYFSGSYFDKASTETYIKCAICGKQLDERTETHEWYG